MRCSNQVQYFTNLQIVWNYRTLMCLGTQNQESILHTEHVFSINIGLPLIKSIILNWTIIIIYFQIVILNLNHYWITKCTVCRPLRQTCSLDSTQSVVPTRTLSVDESVSPSPAPSQQAEDDTAWSSDYTNSEEDEPPTDHVRLSVISNLFLSLLV